LKDEARRTTQQTWEMALLFTLLVQIMFGADSLGEPEDIEAPRRTSARQNVIAAAAAAAAAAAGCYLR
jgi:hypothetical protein